MNRHHLMITGIAGLSIAWGSALAYDTSDAARREAAARYSEDKKLCAEESTSSARMQCLRDAKAEYHRANMAAAEANAPPARPNGQAAVCGECGKVIDVRVVEKEGQGTALGLIAGGVAGAVLGHQVGQGHGKDLATVAGAAGGAYAGHKIEENARSTKSWVVKVQFDNGDQRSFSFKTDPGFAIGTEVRSTSAGLVRR